MVQPPRVVRQVCKSTILSAASSVLSGLQREAGAALGLWTGLGTDLPDCVPSVEF